MPKHLSKSLSVWIAIEAVLAGISLAKLVEFPNPDVPETDRLAGIAVCLQLNRRRVVLLVRRLPDVEGLALQLKVVLYQYAALSHDIGSDSQRPFGIVIVGALIVELAVSLVLLPALYLFWARPNDRLPAPEAGFFGEGEHVD